MTRLRAAIAATILALALPALALAHSATPGPCETITAASAPGFTLVLNGEQTFGPFEGDGPYVLHVAAGTYSYQFFKVDGSKDKEGFGTIVVEPCSTPSPTPEVTPTPTPDVTPTPTPSASHPVVTPTPSHHLKTPPPSDAAAQSGSNNNNIAIVLIALGIASFALAMISLSLRKGR